MELTTGRKYARQYPLTHMDINQSKERVCYDGTPTQLTSQWPIKLSAPSSFPSARHQTDHPPLRAESSISHQRQPQLGSDIEYRLQYVTRTLVAYGGADDRTEQHGGSEGIEGSRALCEIVFQIPASTRRAFAFPIRKIYRHSGLGPPTKVHSRAKARSCAWNR